MGVLDERIATNSENIKDIPNQEFADGGATQKWWSEVQVQVRKVVFILVFWDRIRGRRSRPLMNAHRVRERAREEVVITDCEL